MLYSGSHTCLFYTVAAESFPNTLKTPPFCFLAVIKRRPTNVCLCWCVAGVVVYLQIQ